LTDEQQAVQTARVKKGARPWSGFFLGLILGLAVALILQQAGIWPVDRLLLFGSAGLFALIGILIGGAGRERVGAFSSIVPLLLAVALIAYGATGLSSINESGELNGGCTVEASSDVDSTVVTDTSRQDPFEVDPDGGPPCLATSPAPITNHLWKIYVGVGGFPVTVADNDEPEPNTSGDQENIGVVADVSSFVDEVSEVAGVELTGVFLVGGDIEGEGGACDGFGFVRLTADPLTTLISQIAAGVGLLALTGLLVLAFNRTREAEIVVEDEGVEGESYAEVGGAGAVGAAASGAEIGSTTATGAHERREGVIDEEADSEVDEETPHRDDM